MTISFDLLLSRFTEDASREFLRYWMGLRVGGALPDRRDIDTSAIVSLLPKLWMWEWKPDLDDFVCRLAGEEIVQVFKRNPRGMTLKDWMPEAIVDVAGPRYRRVIEEPAICVASGLSYVADNRSASCERVITPLRNGGPQPQIVFGMTVWRVPEHIQGAIEREKTEAKFYPL